MMATNRRNHCYGSLQQGFMAFEALVVITVLVSLMSLGARYITKNAENTVNQVTAQQLQQITQAAQHYVQDHYPSFKKNSNLTLTWKQLVEEGYLSSLVSDKNHYGQAYRFTVMKEQQGTMQLLLTTEGGLTINEHSLRQIAARAGSSAGYASVLDPGNIVGTQRSWVLEGTALSPGHLASLVLVNEQEVMDATTFLRRTQIAGHPEYNTMQADLNIENHLLTIKGKDNSRRVTLSSNTITLRNPFGKDSTKTLILDVAGTPSLSLKDTYNPFNGANSRLSGTSLAFSTKDSDGDKLTLSNKDNPGMSISNQKKGLSTSINIAEITLKNTKSKNKSYLNTDKIVLSSENNDATILSASNLSLNNQILIDKNFIKIPIHTVNNVKNPYDIQAVAEHKVRCIDNQGRLFLVGDQISIIKYLCMCVFRPNNQHHSYIIINNNETSPGTNW